MVTLPAVAVSAPSTLTYEGHLEDAIGPVSGTVSLTFHVDADDGINPLCRLISETHSSVTVTDGHFSVRIGSNSPQVHGGQTWTDAFKTTGTVQGASCSRAAAGLTRWLRVHLGADVTPLGSLRISSAPTAIAAERIGESAEENLVRVPGVQTSALTSTDWTELLALINGTSSLYAPSGGNGTVTSVATGAGLTGGTITTSGTIAIATGGVTDAMLAGSISAGKISGNIPGNAAGFSGSLGGDVTGTQGATTVTKLQGIAVSNSIPANGNFLKYNGTNWLSGPISLGDLKSTLGGNLFHSPGGCSPNTTMTYSAVTDQFSCVAINGLAASTITSGTLDEARLPATINGAKTFSDNIATQQLKIGPGDGSACTNAPSDGGRLRYNSTSGYMEYCNHVAAQWLPLVSGDTSPDPFTIADVTTFPSTAIEYSLPTIMGLGFPVSASISGPGSPEICNTNSGCTWSSSVAVSPGASIMLKVRAQAPASGISTFNVTVGTYTTTWNLHAVATVNCLASPSVGNACVGGGIYAGVYNDGVSHDIMIMPLGCDSTLPTPNCTAQYEQTYLAWQNSPTLTNVTGTNGALNTASLAALGSGVAPAAEYCASVDYGGHTDWYLPSLAEYQFLHNQGANLGSLGQLYSSYYWTSQENDANNAKAFYGGDGNNFTYYKTNTASVRCMRRMN